MEIPDRTELIELLRSLPAAAPLLDRLRDVAGVHVVGGAVRDLLLGGRPTDLDLVVEGDAAAAAARLGGERRVHDRFGTSTVTVNGRTYDIARARTESYSRPGALPDVAPASLVEDLRRRDFTVNAMAVALGGATPGELSAAPRAFEDLESRQLRVLHDRSFVDDPTRLLRLVRYASRLGFEIEPHTRALAGEAVRGGALQTVTGPRIGTELRLLAREPDPVGALGALHALDLDGAIYPGFGLDEGDRSLARRALELLPDDARAERLALAVAARGLPREQLSALLDRLGFEAGDRDAIVAAATGADQLAGALAEATRPSEIARLADGVGAELVALAGALGPAEEARDWLTSLRHVGLEIDGTDLKDAGIPEGPAIGRGLRAALAAKLDGRASGPQQELAEALRAAR